MVAKGDIHNVEEEWQQMVGQEAERLDLHPHTETGTVNWKWGKAGSSQSLCLVAGFLQEGCTISPNGATN